MPSRRRFRRHAPQADVENCALCRRVAEMDEAGYDLTHPPTKRLRDRMRADYEGDIERWQFIQNLSGFTSHAKRYPPDGRGPKPIDVEAAWTRVEANQERVVRHIEDIRSLTVEDFIIDDDHDDTTCRVCVAWARINVMAVVNINDLEKKWRGREPDEHIWVEATEGQYDYWWSSFDRTNHIIEHVVATRPDDEDAMAWHCRVLKATTDDDPVAMHNVTWTELERGRRRAKTPVNVARAKYPEGMKGPVGYDLGEEPIGSGEDATRNILLMEWLHGWGVEWAQGTRLAENWPDELKLVPPPFMLKR